MLFVATRAGISQQSPVRYSPSENLTIVVATDGPGGTISDTRVVGNTVDGSELPGIVIHANAPGDLITDTLVSNNEVSNNGYYPPFISSIHTPVASDGTTGIALETEAVPGMTNPPAITETSLIHNTISDDQIGVWLCGSTDTSLKAQTYDDVTASVVVCGSGGS